MADKSNTKACAVSGAVGGAQASKSINGKAYVAASNPKSEKEEEAKAIENEKENGKMQNDSVVVAVDDPYSNRALYTLRNLNVKVKKGQLVAIVGSVGCGKSSFLSTLLGEMVLRQGEVRIYNKLVDGKSTPQSIAYCDQRPWIVNATVEENITFGKPLNEERMKHAIYAACMDDDVKILSAGLKTGTTTATPNTSLIKQSFPHTHSSHTYIAHASHTFITHTHTSQILIIHTCHTLHTLIIYTDQIHKHNTTLSRNKKEIGER